MWSIPRHLDLPAVSQLPDLGLMMGRSFRAGWGPNGTLVHFGARGPSPDGFSAAQVVVRKLAPEGECSSGGDRRCCCHLGLYVSFPLTRLERRLSALPSGIRDGRLPLWREALTRQLQAHLDQSTRSSVPGCRFPRYHLSTDRNGRLQHLVRHGHVEVLRDLARRAPEDTGVVLQHQATAWELAFELLRYIEGEDEEQAEFDEEEQAASRGYLKAAAERRALVSQLWRRLGEEAVERDLEGLPLGPARVLVLLSGRHLTRACEAALDAGDARLATLLASAGRSSRQQRDLSVQLDVWEREGFLARMDPDRVCIYRLLAGRVTEALAAQRPALDSLDWRRCFGLYLWYGSGASSTGGFGGAVEEFYQDAVDGVAALPIPLYSEVGGVKALGYDICLELLRLQTRHGLGLHGSDFLSRLLRPSGYSSDPLDYSLSWLLADVLQSIDLVPGAPASGPSPWQLHWAHVGLIQQLQALGGMSEWAIFVALHLPDDPKHPGKPQGGCGNNLIFQMHLLFGGEKKRTYAVSDGPPLWFQWEGEKQDRPGRDKK